VKALPLVFSASAEKPVGLTLAALDITQDGARRGQWFDVILDVTA
jgi:hypothetical protein